MTITPAELMEAQWARARAAMRDGQPAETVVIRLAVILHSFGPALAGRVAARYGTGVL